MPLTPWEEPVSAAQTAQFDLMKAESEPGQPRTDLDAFLFMFKIGYREGMGALLREVAPADVVLRGEVELEEFFRQARMRYPEPWDLLGEPEPETEPASDDDHDDFPSGGVNYAMQILRRQKEGVPEKTILPLSSFERLLLEAIEQLASSRLRYAEGIAAMARLLSAQEISVISVFETLNSLEARYAVFTGFPDPLKYADLGGKQYFRMTEIGERSLRKAKKNSAGR
jgi:hypothetical protein